jgi:hypothetical protein
MVFQQPAGPPDRGPLRDQPAARRRHLALRHADRRPLAGGRGRRAAGRPPRLRGRPAPPPGPRPAREERRQPLQRPRLPDPRPRRQGDHRLLLRGPAEQRRALPPAPARPAAAEGPRRRRRRPARQRPRAPDPARAELHAAEGPRAGHRPPQRRGRPALRPPRRRPHRPGHQAPAEPTGVTLLFDTSASRAIDFKGQVARLGKIVEELRAAAGVDFDLRVLCFDQTVEQVFSGKASSFSADAQQAILSRNALGASDLTGALATSRSTPPATSA